MINLPHNWLKYVKVREIPHDPTFAALLVRFRNEHGQVFSWYQVLQAHHGMTAASLLEGGLSLLSHVDLATEDPYINETSREKAESLDQSWEAIEIPGTLNLKHFREKHGLPDPEEVKRV